MNRLHGWWRLSAILWVFISVPASAADLADVPETELIAQLQQISEAGTGFHPTAWTRGFLALDETPEFAGGILGSAKPVVHPALRELVRRGIKALPTLLDHVDDPRPAAFTVGDGFMGKWFGAEYDPRDRDSAALPAGVQNIAEGHLSTGGDSEEKTFDTYRLTVGDLCFVAVGQIVNRSLNAVRYQPSLCVVVNSPVKNPALAKAVRADWSDLDAPALEASLKADIRRSNEVGALQRLCFYFPDTGQTEALRLLARPLYDRAVVHDFFKYTLLKNPPEKGLDDALTWFRKTHGEPHWQGLINVLRLVIEREEPGQQHLQREADAARRALGRIEAGGLDANIPVATFEAQKKVVAAVDPFKSPAIDEAVSALLERTVAMRSSAMSRFEQSGLVEACTLYLVSRMADDPIRITKLQETAGGFCKRIRRENREEQAAGVEHVLQRIEQTLRNLTSHEVEPSAS